MYIHVYQQKCRQIDTGDIDVPTFIFLNMFVITFEMNILVRVYFSNILTSIYFKCHKNLL